MSDEDFEAIVDVFRMLARWRDESIQNKSECDPVLTSVNSVSE